jgi:hypothetical protein
MEPTTRNMSIGTKTEISASNFETDVESVRTETSFRLYRLIDGARLGLTVLALAAGLTILGLSADTIAVYHATYVPEDWFLQLWPSNFDMGPSIALVVGGALVIVANLVSLVAGKIPTVRNPLQYVQQNTISLCFYFFLLLFSPWAMGLTVMM